MSTHEVHSLSVEQIDTLKASAANFGFDGGAIADILEKFGPDVLALVIEAARSGFSIPWIMEVINKFGPTVLQFLADLFHKNAAMAAMPMAMDGEVHNGVVIDGKLVEGSGHKLDCPLCASLGAPPPAPLARGAGGGCRVPGWLVPQGSRVQAGVAARHPGPRWWRVCRTAPVGVVIR